MAANPLIAVSPSPQMALNVIVVEVTALAPQRRLLDPQLVAAAARLVGEYGAGLPVRPSALGPMVQALPHIDRRSDRAYGRGLCPSALGTGCQQ